MGRRWLATIVSLVFAVFWARQSGFATPAARPVLWLLCALFVAIAAGLAARMRWARWLGLAAGSILAGLLSFVLALGYVFSLFGDEAMGLRTALPFLIGIGCATLLAALLVVDEAGRRL